MHYKLLVLENLATNISAGITHFLTFHKDAVVYGIKLLLMME